MFSIRQRFNGESFQSWKHRLRHPVWMGNLRSAVPFSRWGWERGTPVDRHYIEWFLEKHRDDIRGHVLEVQDRCYTKRYGTDVTCSDVLDITLTPTATVVADLAAADVIPGDFFDCFILTQTLQYIFDTKAAIYHANRILRPGGVLLATTPSISRIDQAIPDLWRFTSASCARLFGDAFGPENVEIDTPGNCLAAIAFLAGLAAEEFRAEDLGREDASYPVVICVRAQKEKTGKD